MAVYDLNDAMTQEEMARRYPQSYDPLPPKESESPNSDDAINQDIKEGNDFFLSPAGQAEPEKAAPEEAGQKERIRWTASQYLAQQSPEWIIKGVLPAQGLGLLYGPSGSGKSFLTLDLCAAISLGKPWFGYDIKQPRPVVYCVLEGAGMFTQRIEAWQRYNQDYLPDTFLFDACESFSFANKCDVERFTKGLPEGAFIVFDTQACASLGLDENLAKDAGTIVEMAKYIAKSCNGFVLLVHHTGKDPGKGARGSSAFFAAMDIVIAIDEKNGRKWKIEKNKSGKAGMIHAFDLESIDLDEDNDGDRQFSCAICQNEERDAEIKKAKQERNSDPDRLKGAKLEAWKSFIDAIGPFSTVSNEVWRKAFMEKSTANSPGAKRKAFSKAKTTLKAELERIDVKNDMYFLTPEWAEKTIKARIKTKTFTDVG